MGIELSGSQSADQHPISSRGRNLISLHNLCIIVIWYVGLFTSVKLTKSHDAHADVDTKRPLITVLRYTGGLKSALF